MSTPTVKETIGGIFKFDIAPVRDPTLRVRVSLQVPSVHLGPKIQTSPKDDELKMTSTHRSIDADIERTAKNEQSGL